ncbi:chaplin family protein [Nonomuraea sp. LP-02]|uniref:chaplin family protein n=1 Tax=Nonomuraea sp. LP-02 TaxID=3097960 RepID=UPI002E308F52|nr:chaplin family protein [Nonomuraea sp. LP-02]MED7928860.1 chaplin family protein [Nonomuraea sp. LP-02]
MRTWAKATTPAALLAVAVMSFAGSGTAVADTSGDASVLGGNQVDLPITLPIDISGNSVAAIGAAEAASQGGATAVTGRGNGIPNRTSGNASVGGGNQINVPITAPINACGNAVSLIGVSDAGCKGGATARTQGRGGAGGNRTSGNASVLGGNQINAPISAPLNVCGNAIAIFGAATAGCKGGAEVHNNGRGAGGNRTSGNASVLGGNQVVAPITVPINVCGNAVAAVGRAFAGCRGGSSVHNGGGGGGGSAYQTSGHVPAPGSSGNDTDGRFGVGSGNQVIAPITAPIDACGNAVGNAAAGCVGGTTVRGGGSGAGGNRTSGRAGVLAGNQVVAPIAAPVNVCGNAVAVVGHAFAACKGGATVHKGGRGAGGNRTSGQAGVGSGNQVVAPIAAPVNVCGNAAALLGAAAAACKGGASVVPQQQGAGGNRTSGRAGVLAGNQVVAPIAAPVNVCGNAVAVLGDAAAGCLGGAQVGRAPYRMAGSFDRFGRATDKFRTANGALPGVQGASVPGGTGGLPLLDGLQGVPALSGLGGLQGIPALGALQGAAGGAGGLAGPGSQAVPSAQKAQGGAVDGLSVAQPVQELASGQVEGLASGQSVTKPVQDLATGGGVSALAGEVQKGADVAASLPVVDDASRTFGLPQLPELPGLPAEAQTPAMPVAVTPAKSGKPAKSVMSGNGDRRGRGAAGVPGSGRVATSPARPSSPLSPATDLVGSTPIGGAVGSVTRGLPVGDIGLMSAAQPAGVTGMNSSSLLALALGAMFAASATMFATARRFRFGRK